MTVLTEKFDSNKYIERCMENMPKETKEYLDKVIEILNCGPKIELKNESFETNVMATMLYVLKHDYSDKYPELNSFFDTLNYEIKYKKTKLAVDYKLYNSILSAICTPSYGNKGLTILNLTMKYINEHRFLAADFAHYIDDNPKIKELADLERNKIIKELESDFYKNLDDETIKFLNILGKISLFYERHLFHLSDTISIAIIMALFQCYETKNDISKDLKNRLTIFSGNVKKTKYFKERLYNTIQQIDTVDNPILLLSTYFDFIKEIENPRIDTIINYIWENDRDFISQSLKIFDISEVTFENVIEHVQDYYKDKEKTPEFLNKKLAKFKNEEIPELENNIPSISSYGDGISKHSLIISNELNNLVLNDSLDLSVDTIKKLVSQVYQNDKKLTLTKLFKKKESNRINVDAIDRLKEKIENYINILNQELLSYDYMKKYIEIYLSKISLYTSEISKELDRVNNILDINPNMESENYMDYLNYVSMKKILSQKKDSFIKRETIMKQELYKIHMMIINHSFTLDTLKTSRDDIIPLIGSNILIMKGTNTENKALELSHNLVMLLNGLFSKNVDQINLTMDKIKDSLISDATMFQIEETVQRYISNISLVEGNENDKNKLK